jgi:uncharacterized protein (TIGR03067 family)
MKMNPRLIGPIALACGSFIAGAAADDASKDVQRMQGEWRMVAMVREGQNQPQQELDKYTRSVTQNELSIVVEGAEGVATLKSSFTVNASKNPRELDVTRTNGPTKGQTALGIYEFDTDELKICISPPGKERPTEFVSAAGSGHVITVWKRVKTQANAADGKLDPKVVQLIRQVGEFVQAAKTIRADGLISMVAVDDLRKVQVSYSIEAPNRLRLRSHPVGNDQAYIEMVCDGSRFYVYDAARSEYTDEAPLRGVGDMGDRLFSLGIPNAGILFRNLLSDDPSETLMTGVLSCAYAGIERIDDRAAHYLKFSQADFNWELWVAEEGPPVVLKMRSVFAGDRGTVFVESYRQWEIDGRFPEGSFKFEVPQRSKKVDRLSAGP